MITDPPYYDAIPYSDLMDWFYIWLRRVVFDLTPDYQQAMAEALGPKWNADAKDGELIDDASRHDGDLDRSKRAYEEGMAMLFADVPILSTTTVIWSLYLQTSSPTLGRLS